jgi:hypothetical protein
LICGEAEWKEKSGSLPWKIYRNTIYLLYESGNLLIKPSFCLIRTRKILPS